MSSLHGGVLDSVPRPDTGAAADAELAKAIMSRQSHPSVIGPEAWEGYIFSDMEIKIKESTDLYGAVLWPSVRSGAIIQYSHSADCNCSFNPTQFRHPKKTGHGFVPFPGNEPGQIQPGRQERD